MFNTKDLIFPDMTAAVESGMQSGNNFMNMVLGSQVNRMRDIEDPTQRQAFANKNFFGRQLRAQLKEDDAAAYKAQLEQQKALADIGKVQSEAFKNNTQGQGYGLDNSGKVGASVQKAISHASITGDKNAALIGLRLGLGSGEIPQDAYENAVSQLNTLTNPKDIKNFAMGMLDAKYSHQSADNAADNITSRANTKDTLETQKEIAENKLDLEKLIQQQKEARANGEFETMQGEDGITYAVYKSGSNAGKVEPLRIEGGEPLKQQAKNKLDSSALKQVNEYNSQLVQAKASQVKIGGLLKDLKSGTLNLSPQAIIAAEARARIGQSTPSDLAIGRFNTAMNQAVNDVLMAAKGTQTEGDAQRAAQVIAANPPRDNAAALQALQNLALIAKTNINALEGNLNTIYANFGMERPQPKANPSQASNGQPASGKVYTSAMVQQYAKSSGRSVEEVTRKIKESGGAVR